MVLTPSTSSRYDPKFTDKTIKHPGSVMMWRGEWKFGPGTFVRSFKNVTMRGSNCINVLKEHLLTFWRIY